MPKHTAVLLIIHLCFHLNSSFAWNKCCEPLLNLFKVKENNTLIYKCLNGSEYHVPLIENRSNNSYGIPVNCTDNTICIDKLEISRKSNGEIIALSCENKKINHDFQITTIHKCCPDGMFYNRKLKVCERDESSSIEYLHDAVADIFNVRYGFPNCGRRVFMENNYENVSVSVQNGTLQLALGLNITETFLNETYCIDTQLNNELLSAVVVYCIPLKYNVKTMCTENTCVPKCCPFGHTYRNGLVKKYECFPEWEEPFHPLFENGPGGGPGTQ